LRLPRKAPKKILIIKNMTKKPSERARGYRYRFT